MAEQQLSARIERNVIRHTSAGNVEYGLVNGTFTGSSIEAVVHWHNQSVMNRALLESALKRGGDVARWTEGIIDASISLHQVIKEATPKLGERRIFEILNPGASEQAYLEYRRLIDRIDNPLIPEPTPEQDNATQDSQSPSKFDDERLKDFGNEVQRALGEFIKRKSRTT